MLSYRRNLVALCIGCLVLLMSAQSNAVDRDRDQRYEQNEKYEKINKV